MSEPLTCAAAPCKSCPYRQDVPSGVWDQSEYDKLPGYDGGMIDQLAAGTAGVFMCHQQDGRLCAGWVACHGAENLVAFRFRGAEAHPDVWDYATKVPVFESGRAARNHGMRDLESPGPQARKTIDRLLRKG